MFKYLDEAEVIAAVKTMFKFRPEIIKDMLVHFEVGTLIITFDKRFTNQYIQILNSIDIKFGRMIYHNGDLEGHFDFN